MSFLLNFENVTWDDKIVNGLDFIQNYVLQVPIFLMHLMRYITPALDNMYVRLLWHQDEFADIDRFMDSLAWVDKTYYEKHKGEESNTLRDTYYLNLRQYPIRDGSTHTKSTAEAISMFLMRFGKRAGLSLAAFGLSYVPVVGRFVLPLASVYTFKSVAGLGPAAIVFGTGIFLPRRYLVIFLQTYFSSRSLMRELVRGGKKQC